MAFKKTITYSRPVNIYEDSHYVSPLSSNEVLMNLYDVYLNQEGEYKAIKNGFSWPGFFFSLIWVIIKGLWIPLALILGILALVFVLAGIAESSGAIKPGETEAFMFFFEVVQLAIALGVGMGGNSLVGKDLERRGYTFVKSIDAHTPISAIATVKEEKEAREKWKGDN